MAVDLSEINKYQNDQTFLFKVKKMVDNPVAPLLGWLWQFSKSDALVQSAHLHLAAGCMQVGWVGWFSIGCVLCKDLQVQPMRI